jgi:guanylate kinase
MLTYPSYDFAVVNDDLERAGDEVQAITLASRCRVSQREERIREILKSFGG